jgi:hypothetical protein
MTEQGRENHLFDGFEKMDEQGKAFLENFTQKLADIPCFAQKPERTGRVNVRGTQSGEPKTSTARTAYCFHTSPLWNGRA